jgi:hypothetical protein
VATPPFKHQQDHRPPPLNRDRPTAAGSAT